MSFDSLLVNTCTIKKLSQAPLTPDLYGNPAVSWTDVLGEPCRWSTPANREVKIGAEVVIADLQLFLSDDADVTEQDRIELDTVTFEILSVSPRQDGFGGHHKELMIRTVK